MSPKQLLRIAVALGVLLVLWSMGELLSRGSDTTTARFEFPALTEADADSVILVRPTDTLHLAKRSGTEWSVNGFFAASQPVSDLFRALKDTGLVELVAQSPTSHGQLGVDSARGKQVTLFKGADTLARLIVGGRGPGFQGVYVRRPGENSVYLLTTDLGNVLDRQLEDWRDKRVAEVEPDSVREVRVQLRRGGYALRHGDQGWAFATGQKADSGEVRRMLEQYRSFLASGFATPAQADSLDFGRPTRRITLSGRTAPMAELLFDSTATWWYVRRAAGGTIYRLESWRLPQLFPADSSLRAKPDTANK